MSETAATLPRIGLTVADRETGKLWVVHSITRTEKHITVVSHASGVMVMFTPREFAEQFTTEVQS